MEWRWRSFFVLLVLSIFEESSRMLVLSQIHQGIFQGFLSLLPRWVCSAPKQSRQRPMYSKCLLFRLTLPIPDIAALSNGMPAHCERISDPTFPWCF